MGECGRCGRHLTRSSTFCLCMTSPNSSTGIVARVLCDWNEPGHRKAGKWEGLHWTAQEEFLTQAVAVIDALGLSRQWGPSPDSETEPDMWWSEADEEHRGQAYELASRWAATHPAYTLATRSVTAWKAADDGERAEDLDRFRGSWVNG